LSLAADPTRSPVFIIGAGPAGMAVGACLQKAGISSTILEQSDRVGASWHRHYERLHLHTDKDHSALPFLPFPREVPRYPSRKQVIDYLEAYTHHFHQNPRLGQRVVAARYGNGCWQVQTQDTHYQAAFLVIAAGYNREPHLPQWPNQDSFQGRMLHSSQYTNGEGFQGQKVLVVGFGNSGGEIAIDLCEHGAEVSMAVRGPVNVIPREILGIPILSIGILQRKLPTAWADALNAPILRSTIGDLEPYGLRRFPRGPLSQIHQDRRIPLIDIGTLALIRQGRISIHPGIESFNQGEVYFKDGQYSKYDAVILATGFKPKIDGFLENAGAVLDENGTPTSSGQRTSMPGLYFCGYYTSPTGMLREIAMEARQIARLISQQAHTETATGQS